MIDELTFKFVDDVTMSWVIDQSASSQMQAATNQA
jgi:hypothetical protein